MLTFIANIPIFRRLFYAFLLAAVIPGIVITILGFTFINTQTARSQAIQTATSALQATADVDSNLDKLDGQPAVAYQDLSWVNTLPPQDKALQTVSNVRNQESQFETALTQYQQYYQIKTAAHMSDIRNILTYDDPNTALLDDQQNTLNQLIKTSWPAYKAAQEQVLKSIEAGKAPSPKAFALVNQRFAAVKTSWNHVEQIAGIAANDVAQVGPSQTRPILLATIIAFLSTIMVVIAIGYIINLTITRPLKLLATLTKRIARGETTARARIAGRDEVGMVATSMNNMLDNIVRLIQETQSQRDSLQAQVEKLVSEVSGVGEGDLRVQAEVTADALGVLADSFNYMVEELGSLVVRVKMVASEVEKSAASTLDRMTQLVETGDAQIGEIAQAAIEVEHMAGSSRLVAERAQVLYDVARVARQDAQVGREAVQQAVEGMGRINENVQATAGKVQTLGERSREINEIVDAISSIAHQTNRLALDAAIQAAMAGENGKGFGAVAADIRRLAERAKEQTSTITRIVRSVREDIGAVAVSMQDTERETSAGARLTQEAGVALESIFAAVEHQAREIENINQMAMQQLQSTSAIVRIMHGVSETTQQSSASTREASQDMQRLARLVEQLRSSVEAFKLREQQDYFVPDSGTFSIKEEPDNSLTVSAVFRTVSATASPAQLSPTDTVSPNLLAERSEDSFSFFPAGQTSQPSVPTPSGSLRYSNGRAFRSGDDHPGQQWDEFGEQKTGNIRSNR